MPIALQWLDKPTQQDCIDLDKLYADAPSQWLSAPKADAGSAWVSAKHAQGERIALGRFNDRIVCGACLQRQSDSNQSPYLYQITQLCVRSVTRRRGVAKQLLVRLCQWANENQCALYIQDTDAQLVGLYELGFVQYLQGWRYVAR